VSKLVPAQEARRALGGRYVDFLERGAPLIGRLVGRCGCTEPVGVCVCVWVVCVVCGCAELARAQRELDASKAAGEARGEKGEVGGGRGNDGGDGTPPR
jgi:hypothetical protein